MNPPHKIKSNRAIWIGLGGLLVSALLFFLFERLTPGAVGEWQWLVALPTFVLLIMSLMALLYGLVCCAPWWRNPYNSS